MFCIHLTCKLILFQVTYQMLRWRRVVILLNKTFFIMVFEATLVSTLSVTSVIFSIIVSPDDWDVLSIAYNVSVTVYSLWLFVESSRATSKVYLNWTTYMSNYECGCWLLVCIFPFQLYQIIEILNSFEPRLEISPQKCFSIALVYDVRTDWFSVKALDVFPLTFGLTGSVSFFSEWFRSVEIALKFILVNFYMQCNK